MISNERKQALFLAMQKLEAYHEIQNQMGRVTAAFNFRQCDKVLGLFALEREDVAVEFADEGVFEGREAVAAILNELIGNKPQAGEMLDMQLTTPMIEVADDVQTAKCVWWCPGIGAKTQETGDPAAIWAWGQLAVDFLNTGGEWKIWHLHYFRTIKCSYEKGWVEDTSMNNRLNVPVHPLSKPTTYHNPYSPLSIRDGIPAMPRPYKTFNKNERLWELDRNKTK
ncbi:MAG: nuclear transport factor 2 family protein [Lachnospiraceae bacterium]